MLDDAFVEFLEEQKTATSPTGTDTGTKLTVLDQANKEKRENEQPPVEEKVLPKTNDNNETLESKLEEEEPSANVNGQQVQANNPEEKEQAQQQ